MQRKVVLVVAFSTIVVWAALASTAGGQSPPPWPTPVPSPAPAATPAPVPTDTPLPANEPGDANGSVEPVSRTGEGSVGQDEEGHPVEPADEDDRELPSESGGETNPGEVAFTDYQAFDLDSIEHEPLASKWKAFVSGVRGLGRYDLFDGKLKFRIGGRLQVDGMAGSVNPAYEQAFGSIGSTTGFRRVGAFAVGRLKDFNFNLAFDFGPDWGLSDAWIEGSEGGLEVWGRFLGKLRVGLMTEPFSLERQTSSYNIGLLERSLPVQTFSPGSNIGAMVHDAGEGGRFTWAAGLFSVGKRTDQNASTSLLSLTGRATYLLEYRNEGRNLTHIGLSASSRSPSSDTRYFARPEARFADTLVDTGDINSGNITLLGFEAATVRGPLWMQGELIQSRLSAPQTGDPRFSGAYLQVGWFITGESRPYRTNSGTFERLQPRIKYSGGNPFLRRNGGAWEIVGRVSRVDLNDGAIDGGTLTDFSGALSWYLNATTRVGFNYIHARPQDRGSANIFLLRVQYQPW